MANQLERESYLEEPQVIERPDSLPEKIEKTVPGVQVVPTQFKKQITDDQGRPLVEPPQTKKITIELPKPQSVLEEESKGSPDEAKTWLARFWLRLIDKARIFGWQIMGLLRADKN